MLSLLHYQFYLAIDITSINPKSHYYPSQFHIILSKNTIKMKGCRQAQADDVKINFHPEPRHSSESRASIMEIKLEYNCRRHFREKKLSKIKDIIDGQTQGKIRKTQGVVLYFINILIPLSVSFLIAYILLVLYENRQIKAIAVFTIALLGMITSFISSLLIAPWKEVLKMYLQIDSIVPTLISAIIAFYSVLNFFGVQEWYKKLYAISFPLWTVYASGSLRIQIAYANWKKWQIILYKLSVLFCGLVSFYIGYEYMLGKYKVTKGFYIQKQTQLRQLVYLYVFGNVEFFFELFRKLSQFDQTNNLKHEYCFEDHNEKQNKIMADLEYKQIQQNALQEELNDLIAAHLQGQMFNSLTSDSQL